MLSSQLSIGFVHGLYYKNQLYRTLLQWLRYDLETPFVRDEENNTRLPPLIKGRGFMSTKPAKNKLVACFKISNSLMSRQLTGARFQKQLFTS